MGLGGEEDVARFAKLRALEALKGLDVDIAGELRLDEMQDVQSQLELLVRNARGNAENAAAKAIEAELRAAEVRNRGAAAAELRERAAANGVNGADGGEAMRAQLREMDTMLDQLRQQLDKNRMELESIRPQLMLRNGATEGMNVVISDDDGTARLTVEDGQARVRISEDSEVVYDGPWPTGEALEDLSESNRQRLRALERYVPENVRNAEPARPAEPEREERNEDVGQVGVMI